MNLLRSFVYRHAVPPGIALVLELLFSGAGLHAETDVKWNWRLPFPTGNELHGVVHGQGTFVVVGDHGTLLTSTNGATWMARDTMGEVSLNAVAYGDGGFVAVGSEGTVLTSLDAGAWRRTTLPGAYHLDAIRFVQGTCLIAAHRDSPQASAFFTSTNLTDWTRRDFAKDQWIRLLTQGNGSSSPGDTPRRRLRWSCSGQRMASGGPAFPARPRRKWQDYAMATDALWRADDGAVSGRARTASIGMNNGNRGWRRWERPASSRDVSSFRW